MAAREAVTEGAQHSGDVVALGGDLANPAL